jgi:hypothetical protein
MQNHSKHNIQKTVVFLLTLLTIHYSLFTAATAASVEATLSTNEAVQGNMVQLKIKAIGNRAAFPDIKEIGGSQVVGRHQSQNNSFTYINGEMKNERSTSLVLTFAPQHDMTIPSYSVNIDGTVYKTDPIALKVVKSKAPQTLNNDKFSLQMRADKKSVIEGEPILVTVYFSLENGVRISENPQYNAPSFKGFLVKEVDEEKTYREGNRQVTELKYLLTPQREGNFTIGPATAKVGVSDTSRRDMFGRFFGTVWIPIHSNSINIEVKPTTQNTDLVGSFYIENSIDKQQVKANKPVNLTVKIEGEGSLEDFEFPEYEIDGVTIYSDDAKVDTEVIGKKLKSTYVKSFAFIAENDFTIPSRSISVYDTKTGTVKTLEVPSYEIKVESKKAAPATIEEKREQHAVVQTNIKQDESLLPDTADEKVEVKNIEWWMLMLAFVSGLFIMYLFKYMPLSKFRREKSPYSESEALKILYAHINESKEIEEMVRKLYARKNSDKSVVIDKKVLRELVEKVKKSH